MTEQGPSRQEFDAERFATRREFDQLLTRVETMDSAGTRGVAVLQQQVIDLTKDVVELKTSMNHQFEDVDKRFEKQRLERIAGRRWLIGIGFTGIGSMGAIITLLVQILQHIH